MAASSTTPASVNGQILAPDTQVFTDNFLMPSADNVAGMYPYEHYYTQSNGDINNNTIGGPSVYQCEDDLSRLGSTDENDDVFREDTGKFMAQTGYGSESLDLVSAAYEAVKSRRLTPLLKHELKFLIQSRRMSQGMDEMAVQFDTPSSGQLSCEERERIERRRQQNRMAARRFRQKRKSSEESLVQTIELLQKTNRELSQRAQQLRNERQALTNFVAEHLAVCPCLGPFLLENLTVDCVP
ncbi:unnamed protein product [Lymnaea stagnalis]|uniref:BZIP domain-containing protein n=1 Tax=Lymnaea stagnalis TaxID=6523 RepID=A0AAV2H6Y3_LYMST